jgi:hypothetical protein
MGVDVDGVLGAAAHDLEGFCGWIKLELRWQRLDVPRRRRELAWQVAGVFASNAGRFVSGVDPGRWCVRFRVSPVTGTSAEQHNGERTEAARRTKP